MFGPHPAARRSAREGGPTALRRLLTSTLLLLSGLVAYWFLQPGIRLFDLLGIQNPDPFDAAGGRWALLLRHHFADAAWCVAAYLVADLLLDERFPRFYPAFLIALPPASEFLQGAGILPGAFDWIDLSIYLAVFAFFATRRIFPCVHRRGTSQAFSSSPSSP